MFKLQTDRRTSRRKLGRHETWLAELDRLGVQFLVLDLRRDRDLVQAARSNPRWAIDFEDREAVLFVRAAA